MNRCARKDSDLFGEEQFSCVPDRKLTGTIVEDPTRGGNARANRDNPLQARHNRTNDEQISCYLRFVLTALAIATRQW